MHSLSDKAKGNFVSYKKKMEDKQFPYGIKPTMGMMFMAMALPKVMKLRVSLRIVF